MSNIRYAVLIIGALSLLLGLSLGQIYFQHQKIEQLEFNRFRDSGKKQFPRCNNMHLHDRHMRDAQRSMERAWEKARQKQQWRNEVDEVEKRLQEAIYRYNRELKEWEKSPKWESTKNGLYRFDD